MLNWLRRIIRNRRRAIFVYWDGLRIRRIDPIAAFRALKTHPTFDPDTHLALADLGDLDAIKVTLEATRDVFGITAFTDKTGGLIDDETLALIGDFFEYLASLKKKWQAVADFIGIYGAGAIPAGELHSPECQCGLFLNAHRVELRRSVTTLRAIGAAFSGNPDRGLIGAICESAEEAEAEYQLAVSIRQSQARQIQESGSFGDQAP